MYGAAGRCGGSDGGCCLSALQIGSLRAADARSEQKAEGDVNAAAGVPAALPATASARGIASCSPIGLILILNKTKSLEMR